MYLTAVIQEKTFEGYNRQNRTDCNRLNLTLARLNDIPDGGAVGVSVEIDRGQFHVLIVRLGEDARVYLNSCPHVGVRLDWSPGVFMSIDGALIQCATHGALFEPRTGHRISGQTTVMMMSGNLGLGVAVISFNQKLIINLTSDPRLLPDLELLDQHINDVVAELLTMVREQPAA